MYYGFESNRCIFSASGEPAPILGVVVLQDDRDLDINKIQLVEVDGVVMIGDKIASLEEKVALLEAERQSRMQVASQQISLLLDIAELRGDAAAKIQADDWRLYRVDLYELDLSSGEAVWPPLPGAAS